MNVFAMLDGPRASDAVIIDRLITALEAIQKYPTEARAGWVQETLIMAKYHRGDYARCGEMRPREGRADWVDEHL